MYTQVQVEKSSLKLLIITHTNIELILNSKFLSIYPFWSLCYQQNWIRDGSVPERRQIVSPENYVDFLYCGVLSNNLLHAQGKRDSGGTLVERWRDETEPSRAFTRELSWRPGGAVAQLRNYTHYYFAASWMTDT